MNKPGYIRPKERRMMEKYGLTQSEAHYALDRSRKKTMYYTKTPRKVKTYELLKDYGIEVYRNYDSFYGWDAFVEGKPKKIFNAIGSKYKDGSYREYPAITIWDSDKKNTKILSLSTIIWLSEKNEPINPGYVVDHIDNDPFNNDICNLQLLTVRQNLEKNPSKKRQYRKMLRDKSISTGIPEKELEDLLEK